jgi:pilus assembly protein CpaF
MEQVHEQAAAQGDLMAQFVERVRQATAKEFPADRILAADDGVRDWVEGFARDWLKRQRQEARASGRAQLAGSNDELVRHVIADVLGLGELETLRQIEDVEDIAINGPKEAYVFRRGKWEPVAGIEWASEDELLELLNRAIAPTGRQVTPLRPICDAILPGGDRINIVMRPCANPSPCVSIRVRAPQRISFLDLVTVPQRRGTGRPEWDLPDYTKLAEDGAMLNAVAATFLHMAVTAGLNILVVGATGVGKTTVLSTLGELIPRDRRIVVIEDTPELRMRETENDKPGNCVYFLTRLRGLEGTSAVTQTDLVRASLRQRPDALTLGEARGGEILDLLKALATGHRNGLTSLHAEGVEEVPIRIKQMFQEADVRVGITNEVVAQWIAQAFHLVISLGIFPDGRRYVKQILEFSGRVEGEQPARQILFRHDRDREELAWTGMRLARTHLFEEHGLDFQTVVDMANQRES